ncbi:amidase [Klenkia soli]|uniref:Amidase n=1 Tax=Klenkia soli TaxID=1052260 RepID=A0A1H0FW57_9ACTN|nr:amidase [Klenkia soli]SDN98729.1 amidase [Klenkia soli]
MDQPRPETTPLWQWSAADLARGIADRTITSREAVTSCLERIEAVNPVLNALVEVSAEEALASADVADQMVAHGRHLGPLHGVPVSIKDNTDEVGHPNTGGVVAHADHVATTDAASTAALRRAGAVLVGRSNVPAFSFRWVTDNELHGRTLNPWDADRTPGGSSGGAAAAVASGMVPVAHGNDIGGSIRYPSFACGLTGLRPTTGRLASSGTDGMDFPLSATLFAVEGPLARCNEDLRLAYAAMLGADSRDAFQAHGATPTPARRPRRIGLVRSVGVADPTPEVDRALDDAAAALRDGGYTVEDVEVPLLAEAYRLWYLLAIEEIRLIRPMMDALGGAGLRTAMDGVYAVAADWWGTAPSTEDYMMGYARRSSLITRLAGLMDGLPYLVMPVSTEQAFRQDADLTGHDESRRQAAAQWSQMAIPLLGFPALAAPTGTAGGLPVGVQVLGRRFDEAGLLDLGAVLEARLGTLTPVDVR